MFIPLKRYWSVPVLENQKKLRILGGSRYVQNGHVAKNSRQDWISRSFDALYTELHLRYTQSPIGDGLFFVYHETCSPLQSVAMKPDLKPGLHEPFSSPDGFSCKASGLSAWQSLGFAGEPVPLLDSFSPKWYFFLGARSARSACVAAYWTYWSMGIHGVLMPAASLDTTCLPAVACRVQHRCCCSVEANDDDRSDHWPLVGCAWNILKWWALRHHMLPHSTNTTLWLWLT